MKTVIVVILLLSMIAYLYLAPIVIGVVVGGGEGVIAALALFIGGQIALMTPARCEE